MSQNRIRLAESGHNRRLKTYYKPKLSIGSAPPEMAMTQPFFFRNERCGFVEDSCRERKNAGGRLKRSRIWQRRY
jgi:hypothetical protein